MQNELQGFYLERKILEDNQKDSGEIQENDILDFSFLEEKLVLDNNNSPFLINEEFEVNLFDFLHGYCMFFATYLHNRFGYEIVNIYNDEDYTIIHSFCIDEEGNFIDVRGKTTDEKDFFSEFEDWVSYYDWQENPIDNKVQELKNQAYKDIYSACEIIVEQYMEYYKKSD